MPGLRVTSKSMCAEVSKRVPIDRLQVRRVPERLVVIQLLAADDDELVKRESHALSQLVGCCVRAFNMNCFCSWIKRVEVARCSLRRRPALARPMELRIRRLERIV